MKRFLLLLSLLAFLDAAHAETVAIANFNMEAAPSAQTDGLITGTLASGWTYAAISGATGVFTFNTATSTRYYNEPDFADAAASGGAHGTMAGPNFTGLSGAGSGSISKTLSTAVAANTRYTLTVALGHRTVDSGAAAAASAVTLELLAGGVSLGPSSRIRPPAFGTTVGRIPTTPGPMPRWFSTPVPVQRNLDRRSPCVSPSRGLAAFTWTSTMSGSMRPPPSRHRRWI